MKEITPAPECWHSLPLEDLARIQGSGRTGLSADSAASKLVHFGPNRIAGEASRSLFKIFLGQFTDFLVLVLLAAAMVSGWLGEVADTITIIVIVVLNAIVGFVQEYRAEKAMEALQKMATPNTRVIRDGVNMWVSSEELVPGDVMVLEAGNVVPADARLFDLGDFWVDEAPLTGESLPVAKQESVLDKEVPLSDRVNMIYKGTLVTKGRAEAMVVATGMASELGRIAGLLQGQASQKSPLQRRLEGFGRRLGFIILGICVVLFLAGLARGEAVALMFLTSVSLAVAAIPEALPAVVTIALALGARRMVMRQALVRRLPAAETLGSVTYICSDKTGTLTQNSMFAEKFFCNDKESEVLHVQTDPVASELARAMALSNDVKLDGGSHPEGDPTEVAIYVAADETVLDIPRLQEQYRRISDLAFDAERKRMTTFHRKREEGESIVAFTKGAPEAVVDCCDALWFADGARPMEDAEREREKLLATAKDLAGQGFRVLAFARRDWQELPAHADVDRIEASLAFLGFVALMDPPRSEAGRAVALCRSAGITPVMITGDHPSTAHAIAVRLGITQDGDRVLSGADISAMDEQEFSATVKDVAVYARVTPEQKIRIVKALQDHGEFVAMTGDGVNDAPALKAANIGVSMGKSGTDVAREASDMILLDDNFATIVSAVREGRRIYDNIRKFIRYTMTSNFGEIIVIASAPFFGLPLPLLPIHILWVNLVTDGLPGLALSVEKAEQGIMDKPPRRPNESIFARGMWQQVLWIGALIGGLSLAVQALSVHAGVGDWQTMVFTVLVFSQLMNALALRVKIKSVLSREFFGNTPMLLAVGLGVLLQLAIIYWPPAQVVFKTSPLTAGELVLCLLLPMVVLFAVEFEKIFIRKGLIYQK